MQLTNIFSKFKKALHLAHILGQVDSVVWDLDGTFYASDKLQHRLRKLWSGYYISYQIAELEGFDFYEAAGFDWYKIVQQVVPKTNKELCLEIEGSVQKGKYVFPLPLIPQFFDISKKKHFLFTNSTRQQSLAVLKKIGLTSPSSIFAKIITLDDLPDAKPAPIAFDYLTKVLAKHNTHQVLYVGDSVKNDLIPAAKKNFRTLHINRYQDHHPMADLAFNDEVELFSYLRFLSLLPLKDIL